MSSATLTTVQNGLIFYGHLTLMVVGNIGNAFIIIIFSRQLKTACSIYLISSAVVNFIFLIVNGYFQAYPYNYNNGTIGSLIFCKGFVYLLNILGLLAKLMLIYACIDRFLITSDRASFRAFSTTKRAKYVIFFSVIFSLLFCLHVPILRSIVNGRCGASDLYSAIFAILFISLVPFVLLAIFGYLSYRNMRKMRTRVQPIARNTTVVNNSFQRRDRDLLIIVIAEVVTYVATTVLYPVVLLETTISARVISNKSAQYSQIESFMSTTTYLFLVFNSAAPFYTYFISSKSFRRDVKQLIINTYRKITGQPPAENLVTTTHSTRRADTRV